MAKKFTFKDPSGKEHSIWGPDDATEQEAFTRLRADLAQNFNPNEFGDDWESAKAHVDMLREEDRPDARRKYAEAFVAREREKGGVGQAVDDRIRMFAQNVPWVGESLDELNAWTSSKMGGDYDMTLAAEKARRKAIDKADAERAEKIRKTARENTPFGLPYIPSVFDALGLTEGDIWKGGGLVAGTAATVPSNVGAIGKPVVQAADKVAKALRLSKGASVVGKAAAAAPTGAAIVGGGIGASEAFGEKEGSLSEKAEAASIGAVTGAVTGYLAQRVGDKIGEWANKRFLKQGPETSEAIKAASQKHFQDATNQGVVVDGRLTDKQGRTFFGRLYEAGEEVRNSMAYFEGISDVNYPGLGSVLETLDKLRQTTRMTFDEIDQIRRSIGTFARNKDPKFDGMRAAMGKLSGKFDEIIDEIEPYVARGNAKNAVSMIKSARKLWQRYRKTEIVEDALEEAARRTHANYVGKNQAAAIRQEFKRILKYNSDKFSRKELDALEAVVSGDALTAALEHLGKLSPTAGTLPLMGSLATGYVNPALAVGGAAVTYAARQGANKMTEAAANKALTGISTGAFRTAPKAQWQIILDKARQAEAMKQAAKLLRVKAAQRSYKDPNGEEQ